MLALNVRTEVMFGLDTRAARAAAKECTAVGVGSARAADGRVLVAQNWDWKPATRETCVLLAIRPTGRPAFVTLVEAGLLAKAGMNDAGLAVATNALTSSRDRGAPGVPYHAILRRMLTSASHEQAVAEVTERRRASSANYLLGSRRGGITDLEVGPGGRDTAWTAAGDLVCHANHFLRPDRPFKDLALLEGQESPERQAAVETTLGAGDIDVASVERALRTHAEPDRGEGSVCAHGDASEPPEADYVTIAGIVMDPGNATMHVTHGNPCASPFERYRIGELLGP